MSCNRVHYILSIILFWINCGLLGCQTIPLIEFGYKGEYWDFEKMVLNVNLVENRYVYEFKAFQNDKLIISRKGEADLCLVKEFWKILKEDSILELKSASIIEPLMDNAADLEILYKERGIDYQSAIIYEFYFITNEKEVKFKVDDVKNISDKRYFLVLEQMNNIAKLPPFQTIFDYHEYLNKR